MFSDIGPLEVLTLLVVAVVLVGPERLPGLVSDTVRTLRGLRELAQGARASLRDELAPGLTDFDHAVGDADFGDAGFDHAGFDHAGFDHAGFDHAGFGDAEPAPRDPRAGDDRP
ncbi:hypothetical protein PV392_09885 [Streptomyces sp. ME03-5709C]|nr:hypothetical protein [Streptomyces sp. ME03-5709C]